jgi:hypothetical protein
MDVSTPPQLRDDEKEVVLIFHDECCFHANDGPGYYWRPKGSSELRRKDRGSALMVSGFICACHGLCDSRMIPAHGHVMTPRTCPSADESPEKVNRLSTF